MLILNPGQNINCKDTAWNELSFVCVNSSASEAQPDWQGTLQGLIGPTCHEKCPQWKVHCTRGQDCTKSYKQYLALKKMENLVHNLCPLQNKSCQSSLRLKYCSTFLSDFPFPCSVSFGLLHILHSFSVTTWNNYATWSVFI